MRRSLALALILLSSTACTTFATDAARREQAEGVANAERTFAAAATTIGVKAAFLEAFADDATIFRPDPVDAQAFISSRPEGPFRLAWQPQRVAVSGSDDLAWSTGPSRLTLNAKPDAPIYGQFFSVWRRDGSGRWRVLIDHGIGHSGPSGWAAPFEVVDGDGSVAGRPVDAAEAEFARLSDADGLARAYRELGTARTRVLREDNPPIDGVAAFVGRSPSGQRWSWAATDSGTSRAADLAWVMGRYRASTPVDGSSSGFYVRVWQVERGEWKILGDVLAPIADGAR